MKTISYLEEDSIIDLFKGSSIVRVENDTTLYLSNGAVVDVNPNSGCWGCVSGNFSVSQLNQIENVITNVEVSKNQDPENQEKTVYTIFVYTELTAGKETLVEVYGDEGNGWYGTGYTLEVTHVS